MLCVKCNYDNPPDAVFCMKCGTKVESRCSSCTTLNPADANFCRKCGSALGSAAPISSPDPAATVKTPYVEVTNEQQTAEGLEGERKTVTALFADIKGSTELMENLDPEEARAIIDPALRIMVEAAGVGPSARNSKYPSRPPQSGSMPRQLPVQSPRLQCRYSTSRYTPSPNTQTPSRPAAEIVETSGYAPSHDANPQFQRASQKDQEILERGRFEMMDPFECVRSPAAFHFLCSRQAGRRHNRG